VTGSATTVIETTSDYTADGSTTEFLTDNDYVNGTVKVYVDGVLVTTGYTVVDGVVIFDTAPADGAEIVLEYEQTQASGTGTGLLLGSSQSFVATAGQTEYTVTSGYEPDNIAVFVNGVKAKNTTEVDTSSGTVLTFSTPLSEGDVVEMILYSSNLSTFGLSDLTATEIVATAGQTEFTVSYNPGFLEVFRNGVRLSNSKYTASNGTSVLVTDAAEAGDVYEFVAYTSAAPVDAYTKGEIDTELGLKADTATTYTKAEVDTGFEPADATILKDADIGVNIQGYDANTTTQGTITLSSLGYTGDTNANYYTLPNASSSVKGGVRCYKSGSNGYIYTS
jgi:hypothetical protein